LVLSDVCVTGGQPQTAQGRGCSAEERDLARKISEPIDANHMTSAPPCSGFRFLRPERMTAAGVDDATQPMNGGIKSENDDKLHHQWMVEMVGMSS
jgi:hypothetical protein